MKKMMALVIAGLLVGLPALSTAGKPVVRMIPMGSVSLLSDGKEVRQFKSEVPLPDGLLMVGEGQCVIQSNGLQLVVQKNAVFALEEQAKQWNLSIKQGRIDFAIRSDAKPVTFKTPHDVIQTQQAVAKVSSEGLVKGFVLVTEDETQLGLLEGTLRASGTGGSRIIEAGKGISLAQASPPGAVGGGGAGATAGAEGGIGGMSWTAIGVGLGATGAVLGGTIAALTSTGDDEMSPQ